MNKLRAIIDNFKKNLDEEILNDYRFVHNGKTGYGECFDLNYWNRKDLIFELYKDYNKTDRPLLKWIIKEEFKGYEADLPVYLTDITAFMLYKQMEISDVYDLYNAKFGAGSDHQAIIDTELIFGPDRERVKEYLRNEHTKREINNEMLSTIEYYEGNPDAEFRSRDEYINFFETKKFKYIEEDISLFEKEVRL